MNCPTGEWRVLTANVGGSLVYCGTLTSSAAYTSVKEVGRE